MAKTRKPTNDRERLAIVVVHGVGEQGRFEHLEAVAANLKQALVYSKRGPHVELHVADSQTRLSPEHSWRESPVTVRWHTLAGRQMEVVFREVHWADLDVPDTTWNWIKLVGWSLSAAGVRTFSRSEAGTPVERGMRAPLPMRRVKTLWVRAQLFLASLAFLLVLATIGVMDQVLKFLSVRLRVFPKIRNLIYSYLGDVKLYQDWFVRKDERLEVIGQKSRVAIRRRMMRALVQAAADVERGELHGYYVFAHSLGTVVAFNALMEPGMALSNVLTEEEWVNLPDSLKTTREQALPSWLPGSRPPWLDGGAAGRPEEICKRDQIDRGRLLAGMRGFLTAGSPLDKFAALWPEIVLINNEDPGCKVPWINVADIQDVVGGKIDLINPSPPSGTVSGLQPTANFRWSDQLHLGSAHTSYWRADEKDSTRLINQAIRWLEGKPFEQPPPAKRPRWLQWARPWISWFTLAVSVPLLLAALLLLLALLVWLAVPVLAGLSSTAESGAAQLLDVWMRAHSPFGAIWRTALALLPVCAAIIFACSAVRWFWEVLQFDWRAGAKKVGKP